MLMSCFSDYICDLVARTTNKDAQDDGCAAQRRRRVCLEGEAAHGRAAPGHGGPGRRGIRAAAARGDRRQRLSGD